jgi:predicted patatin/cPLA2 family phospholipase
MRLALRKYPRLVDTMARRQEVYNETTAYIREKERKGEIFVLRPEAPLPVGKVEHDPEKLQLAYDLGRGVAQKRLAALKDFLK